MNRTRPAYLVLAALVLTCLVLLVGLVVKEKARLSQLDADGAASAHA